MRGIPGVNSSSLYYLVGTCFGGNKIILDAGYLPAYLPNFSRSEIRKFRDPTYLSYPELYLVMLDVVHSTISLVSIVILPY